MTTETLNKIDKLIEEGFSNYVDNFLSFFKDSKFKNLSDKEFNTFVKLISDWYYNGFTIESQIKKNKTELPKLLKKITLLQTKNPNFIYRGLSFQSKAEFNKVIKELDKGIIQKHNSEYTSWSSNSKIAKYFLPGERYGKGNFGILIKLPQKIFKDNILFTTKGLFKNDKEKLEFLKIILKHTHEKNLKLVAKAKNLRQIDSGQLFGVAHGSYYAAVEDEYILKKIKTDQKINYETFGSKK